MSRGMVDRCRGARPGDQFTVVMRAERASRPTITLGGMREMLTKLRSLTTTKDA